MGKRRPRAGAECGDSEAIWADPGLSGPLHVTPLRRSIPQITVSSSDTDELDVPPVDETVGDMIWIPGGMHAEALNTSTSVLD